MCSSRLQKCMWWPHLHINSPNGPLLTQLCSADSRRAPQPLCLWREGQLGEINRIGGGQCLALLCVKEITPVASGPDWPSSVPVARQPSSGVWGLADRQLLMNPGLQVEGACCRKGLSDLLSHGSHVLWSCYTLVDVCTHTLPHTHTHTNTH